MMENESEILQRDMQEHSRLKDRVKTIFGGAMTLKDVVDSIERVSKLQKSNPFNARVLTYDEAVMWNEYRKIGTVEECLRNKDFLDFLSDEMDPDDFEMYLRIYNSLDEKGDSHDGE